MVPAGGRKTHEDRNGHKEIFHALKNLATLWHSHGTLVMNRSMIKFEPENNFEANAYILNI